MIAGGSKSRSHAAPVEHPSQYSPFPSRVGIGNADGNGLHVPERQQQVDEFFEGTAAFWRDVYHLDGLWATVYRQRRVAVLAFVEKLGLPPETHALDIGCGAGWMSISLARRGFRVEAVDTVETMLAETRELALKTGLGRLIKTSRCDVRRLPYSTNTFDLATMIGVAPWLDPLQDPLREVARVLKPDGHLILSVDNRWRLNHLLDPLQFPLLQPVKQRLKGILERTRLRRPVSQACHYFHSAKQTNEVLLMAGLSKIKGTTAGFGPFTFMHCRLFPQSVEIVLSHKLQDLTNHGLPLLTAMGRDYIVLAIKPDRSATAG